MAISDSDVLSLKRQLLFTPLKTEKELHSWIHAFLEIDLPNSTVDPASNSNPTNFIWTVYDKAVNQNDPTFHKVLAYANRGGGKTLSAAILELLMIFHGNRDVAHMAAIEQQAQYCMGYVKDFVYLPIFRDFITEDNKRKLIFTKYKHKQLGTYLTPKEYQGLPASEQLQYQELSNFITVLVARMQSCSGLHASFVVADEIDVIPDQKAYEQLKGVPVQTRDKKVAITLLTSTRNNAFGLVQKEIDKADKTGMLTYHWNIMDTTAICPPTRHSPGQSANGPFRKLPIYVDDAELKFLSEEDFKAAPEGEKDHYGKDEGYEGCLSNCKLFAACKGRLATEQRSSPEAIIVKEVYTVQNDFLAAELDMILAQYLCRKPSAEGMIFSRFNRELHMLSPAQILEKITKRPANPRLTKQELIGRLKNMPDISFWAGMDHGFTHDWTVTVGAKFGHYLFVLDCVAAKNLEIGQKIVVANRTIRHYDATIFGDTENPSDNKTFRLHGYKMRDWKKIKGSVLDGIGIMRLKLNPALDQEPELYFLKGDDGVEALCKAIEQFHWKLDPSGNSLEIPDEEGKDYVDGIRYLVMNVFPVKAGQKSVGDLGTEGRVNPTTGKPLTNREELRQKAFWAKMSEKIGVNVDPNERIEGSALVSKKGGRVKFQF